MKVFKMFMDIQRERATRQKIRYTKYDAKARLLATLLFCLIFAKAPLFAEDLRWGFFVITGGTSQNSEYSISGLGYFLGGISSNSTYTITGEAPGFPLPLQIPPSTITTDNSNAFCYPNPYRKNEEGQGRFIYFDRVSLGAIIKIYTIAGELIAEIDVEKCPEIWEVPRDIASGIYIYTITEGRGGKKTGKIGIVK
ncbi:MAG: T9SS type A sorting domain-containing protein [bacterium]